MGRWGVGRRAMGVGQVFPWIPATLGPALRREAESLYPRSRGEFPGGSEGGKARPAGLKETCRI